MIDDILYDSVDFVLETEPLTETGDITAIGFDDYEAETGSGEINTIF
jgi:hypothetical protein